MHSLLKSLANPENPWRYLLLGLVFVPLLVLRDFTPDNELRYLSIADEALRNGDLFTFSNHGILYADKPPLYLWIVMLGRLLFGSYCMPFLGLFSLLPALGILWVMNRWVRQAVPAPAQRNAGQLMLLTSVYFLGSAVVLRMDMLMCLFITLALWSFYRSYTGEKSRWLPWAFPLWTFLALFTKGPVGLLVPLVSILVFLGLKRDWRAMGRYWGWRTWGVLLLLSGLWFAGVYWEGGPEYLNNLLFKQTAGRAVEAFHHKAPVWYYLISYWYSLAPWSLLVAGVAIWLLAKSKKMVCGDLERFFVVVALSTLTMLSLISSKIQIYLLPAFPFFIYLAILWMARTGSPSERWRGWIRAINIGAVSLLMLVFIASFSIPALNPYIGYGAVASKAKELSQTTTPRYFTFEVRRAENLDAYLGQPVEQLTDITSLIAVLELHNGVLIYPFKTEKAIKYNPHLEQAISTREIHRVGDWAVVAF